MMDNNVTNRITLLSKYLDFLENVVRKEDLETFKSNFQLQLSTERALHIAIEIILDLGNLLINKLNLDKPSTYADIFKILCENDVLPKKLMNTLIDIARFRNLLVHAYAKIDTVRVFEILEDNIELLKEITDMIISKIESL